MSDTPTGGLHALLRRLQAERPGTWLDEVSLAVAAVGGQEARDRLLASLATPAPEEAPPADPEQALAELEGELRQQAAEVPPAPVVISDPPLLPPPGPVPPPRRSMGG